MDETNILLERLKANDEASYQSCLRLISNSYIILPSEWCLILRLSVNIVAFSQTAKISVNFTETSLSEVFAELGKQVKMVFLYDHKLVESKGKVSLKTDNQKLEKVLKEWIILLRPDR